MISRRILFIAFMNVIGIVGWKFGYSIDRLELVPNIGSSFFSHSVILSINKGASIITLFGMLFGLYLVFVVNFIELERNLRLIGMFSPMYVAVFSLLGFYDLPFYLCFILNPVWFLGIFIFDIFHDDIQTTKSPSPISIFYCALLSKIKVLFGGHPLWIIPKDEQKYLRQTNMSNATYFSILDNLKYTPVSHAKKHIFKSQCYQILTNINKAIWKLDRTKQLLSIMYSGTTRNTSQIDEVKRLIEKITQEINQSLDVLSSSSTNLLKVEVSHGDLLFDQLLRNLNESNNRLKNISSVYQDAKGRI